MSGLIWKIILENFISNFHYFTILFRGILEIVSIFK